MPLSTVFPYIIPIIHITALYESYSTVMWIIGKYSYVDNWGNAVPYPTQLCREFHETTPALTIMCVTLKIAKPSQTNSTSLLYD